MPSRIWRRQLRALCVSCGPLEHACVFVRPVIMVLFKTQEQQAPIKLFTMADTLDLPYFWSAQLDGTRGQGDRNDSARMEGWVGFIVFNFCVWVTVVVLDIHLLAYEFNTTNTQVNMLQTAALVTVAIPAITMILFTLLHYLAPRADRPFSSDPGLNKKARTLPPFATALISGGLRTTLIFTVVILLLNAQTLGAETTVVKIVVAQVCLKSFGSAMALANQRLQMFTTGVM